MYSMILFLALVGSGAQQDQAEVVRSLQYVCNELEVSNCDEMGKLISIERTVQTRQCEANHIARGCTLGGTNEEGVKVAHIWYRTSDELRMTLRHEFKHALLWVSGEDMYFHGGRPDGN